MTQKGALGIAIKLLKSGFQTHALGCLRQAKKVEDRRVKEVNRLENVTDYN